MFSQFLITRAAMMLNKKTGGQYVAIYLATTKPHDYISVMEVHQNHIKKCIYYK
jgi:uncharacterized protein YhaN